MKVRIGRKTFDTETAEPVNFWDNGKGRNDLHFEEVRLCRKRSGEYFLHGCGGAATFWGFEDENGARVFGEKIIPIKYHVGSTILRELEHSRKINFQYSHVPDSAFAYNAVVPGEGTVFYHDCFSAPAAENSGGRIG